jgi:phosphohistidine phosphatase
MKAGGERIGLVGHMPQLGDFAAWLLGDKRAQIDLAKAGVAHLVCGDSASKGTCALKWMVAPEWYV